MSLNIKKSDFVKSASKPSQYPLSSYPEFFFAGKSNSGKSSMLNAICNRKKLARTFFLSMIALALLIYLVMDTQVHQKKSQTHGTIWLLIISQAKEILFRCLLLLMLEEGLRSWMRK